MHTISPMFFPPGQAGKQFHDPPPAVLARGEGSRRRPCSCGGREAAAGRARAGGGKPPPAVLVRGEGGRRRSCSRGGWRPPTAMLAREEGEPMWVACEIARLPEELVSAALARTSPRDAYRAAAVSRALRAVADSDDVWEGFLPPDGFLPLADGCGHWLAGKKAETGMAMVPRRTLRRPLVASLLPYPWSGAAPTNLRWYSYLFLSSGIGTTIELESDEDGGHLVLVETSDHFSSTRTNSSLQIDELFPVPLAERRGRLELAERRRQRLELPDRQPNLSNSSKEDATKCLVSLGDLIDVEKLGGGVAGSATLHLRVTGMATAGNITNIV
ncbi:uncharacterized protein LOC123448157 isoform X2 [Hordeum vulgare subsp. vulgare]|uniref:uncharacterized protein LOC123448157 isoform X2 n=1 Tax=Hordeum vulgare subsp. vulgare TaxID=112509 RepID=UPI001D1A4ACC|nr:uncharacterized protein LOC123448157 isoform X2 [Hordeum vulgare subsp. vulgare]